MADTAIAPNYDSIIDRQQKRILELEADLARYTDKIRLLKTQAAQTHQAAMAAAAAAAMQTDYARFAMMTMPPAFITPRTNPEMMPIPREDDERAGKTRYWTEMEHNQFLYAVKLFGPKNYVAISQFVGSRTPKQVRTHAQKYQMKLEREAKKRRAQAAAVAAVACSPVTRVAASVAGVGVMGNVENGIGIVSTGFKMNQKSESENGQSVVSTCPSVEESTCSPQGGDCGGAEECGEEMEKKEGIRKNASLGNLVDYDDFMRRITCAVEESREGGFERSEDVDMDILHEHPKTEQFEDSLLADI